MQIVKLPSSSTDDDDKGEPEPKYTRSKSKLRGNTVLPSVCVICQKSRKSKKGGRRGDEKLSQAETLTCGKCNSNNHIEYKHSFFASHDLLLNAICLISKLIVIQS